jgi:hypothetical protein
MYWFETSEPPQNGKLPRMSDTCHGHSPAWAFCPPTILEKSLKPRPFCPHDPDGGLGVTGGLLVTGGLGVPGDPEHLPGVIEISSNAMSPW